MQSDQSYPKTRKVKRYVCICSPECNYACDAKISRIHKAIRHVLKVHFPEQSVDWIRDNFSQFFEEKEVEITTNSPKKKTKVPSPSVKKRKYSLEIK